MSKRGKTQKRETSGLRAIAYFGFAVAGALLILMIWAALRPASPPDAGATANRQAPNEQFAEGAEGIPAYFASADAARPYPAVLPAVEFSRYPAIERAYGVAAKIPGVLAQQPCYCHCDRMGHRSLLDCYASEHAAGCDICLMEALYAGQMTRQGQNAATIREEVIRGEWRDIRLDGQAR